MTIRHLVLATLALVACAPPDEDLGEASAEVNTPGTLTVGAVTLTTENVAVEVPAHTPDGSITTCNTKVSWLSVRGTAHDAETNAILRGTWEVPTSTSCTEARVYRSDFALQLVDADQGLLAVIESNAQSGGIHGFSWDEHKVIDLRSGKRLSVGDYVKPDSSEKLLEIANRTIETTLANDEWERERLKRLVPMYFMPTGTPATPSELVHFVIAATGLRVEMFNGLPFDPQKGAVELVWRDLEAAGVLRTDTDLIARTKAVHPPTAAP